MSYKFNAVIILTSLTVVTAQFVYYKVIARQTVVLPWKKTLQKNTASSLRFRKTGMVGEEDDFLKISFFLLLSVA